MMDNAAGQPEGSGHEEKLPDRDLEVAEITRHLDELERTNRALRLLSAMNQALMHVTTEAELIKRICEIAVDVGLYRLAWVGFAEHDAARTVRPICHAGTELGYLHQLYFSWADDEHCDPAGMAIRTAKPTVLADIANMSTCAPWRAAALAHGLRSTIALPLQKDEQVIGALTLHGDAPDTFTPEEVQLLTELAGDLSFGITAIRTRDRQRRAEEALHESERRFRLLAENSTDIITRHTPEGVFRYVSPASRTLLGYAPEELVGHNAMQYVHSDDLAMVQTFYQQLLTQQHVNVSTLTFRGRRKDGEYRWLEITARAIRDTDTGHVIEFQVATRDVTERQQTAQALQESERRFRTLIANLPGMVYRCRNDQRWTMEYLSEGCRQLTGYAPDDLLQNAKLSYADLIHPDDAATVWEQVQRELQAHRPFQVTYRIVTASGAIKWVWEQGRAVVNAHGDVQSIEGYMTDITEWTEAEIAVKQREATLRAIFAAALNVSFIITDVDDRAPRVVEFSPGAEHIFGYTRDEMLGQPVNRLHRQEDIAQFPATHRAMREGHAGFSGETVLIRKNSDAFPALFSTYPLFDEQGNMYAALGVSIDITEQKRIEEQLRQTGEELDQFFNLAPDLLAIADTDGHFRRLNPSWERTLGYTREELLAGLFFDFVHPDDLASTHEAVAQLSAQRRVINFVNRFRCRDGSYRWIEWLSASAGTRIYAAARDITDRLHAEEALRESEQRYRMLIERLPLPVAIYGASGDVEYLNNQFVKVLGYTLADIPTIADWWPRAYPNPEYRREVMTVWTEALADAERSQTDIAPHEYRVTCKDGTVRTMEILAKNMGNTYLILWNDVTERRRTEAALRLKEYQLEESQRNAHIGTYVLDIPAGCWTSSAGLDDLFGITPDYPHTLVGWLGIIHPDNREMMAHYLPEIAIPNRVFNKVYRIVRQNDGALRWVWGLGKITCSQEGVPREMIGTIQDITERKLAEDALRESEERFRTLIEKAPVAIGMARHMFGIYANPAYERMFRLRGPEDAAVPVIERYATQIRDWMIENLRAREEGQPTAMEFDTIGLRADGTEFPMHVA
ncbi:MAG TPA: PAS domain S-box protein, partial [Armatimonadota bacterium]